jgi:membrane AbrB-like protein
MSRAGVQALRWAGVLVLSAAFVAFFEWIGMPATLLLGPMLAAIVFAGFEKQVAVPPVAFSLAQGVIGCMIAASIPIAILGELARDWPIFIAGIGSAIVAACTMGWLLARFQILPGTTAIWGSFPGAASAMTLMAETFGADMRLVAFMQYLRVVCVSVVASSIAAVWVGHTGAPRPATVWFPPLDWLWFAATLALIAASFALTYWRRIPSGMFLLPMLAGILLINTGLMKMELPPWLLALSYAMVGWTIGSRFTRPILRHATRAFPRVLASILALIAICGTFAAGLVAFGGIDPLTAYLATSPGGADSVAIISASVDVDVPFVMAMQLGRFLVILIAGPALARMVVKWSGLKDGTQAPPG